VKAFAVVVVLFDTSLQGWPALGYVAAPPSRTGVLLKGGHSRSWGVEVEQRVPRTTQIGTPQLGQLKYLLKALGAELAHKASRLQPGDLLLTSHAAASPGHGGYLTTCFVGAVLLVA
jgi:hypothetical protein